MESDSLIIVNSVIKQLEDFYKGDPWVTDNFRKKIRPIAEAEAILRIEGHNHSIAQLVSHITAWTNFGLQKLTGNNDFDIEDNSPADWPQDDDWDRVCSEFGTSHQNLLLAIRDFPSDRWNSKVPGRNYSFLYMINGIVQHDYYHYGQIGSVLAAIKKTKFTGKVL
jgi:uncharacterized damage-inducible protein DinB